jgi:hypothetical protein
MGGGSEGGAGLIQPNVMQVYLLNKDLATGTQNMKTSKRGSCKQGQFYCGNDERHAKQRDDAAAFTQQKEYCLSFAFTECHSASEEEEPRGDMFGDESPLKLDSGAIVRATASPAPPPNNALPWPSVYYY